MNINLLILFKILNMVETEMSLQSDFMLSNPYSKTVSSNYIKVDTKDEDLYIDPKDIKLGKYSNDQNQNTTYPVNSNSLLPISIDQKQNYFYKKLGNTYSFFGDIYGNPRIIIGPHWPLYVFVSFIFTLGFFSMLTFFGKYFSILIKLLGLLIYFLFLFSYSYTALINPGYPKHDIDSVTGEPRKKFYFCTICKMWVNREKRAYHCADCNICVEGLDHHCPWTGKCIGSKNIISFYIFIFSIFALIGHFVLAMTTIDHSALIKNKK